LHVGFDRLDELLADHPNLYFDTSIGMFVRWGDRMYNEDRECAREFFMKWSDRILFGTDCIFKTDTIDDYLHQHFLGHVRYVRQLNLPQEELEQVAHRNTERLMDLEPAAVERRGALRP